MLFSLRISAPQSRPEQPQRLDEFDWGQGLELYGQRHLGQRRIIEVGKPCGATAAGHNQRISLQAVWRSVDRANARELSPLSQRDGLLLLPTNSVVPVRLGEAPCVLRGIAKKN